MVKLYNYKYLHNSRLKHVLISRCNVYTVIQLTNVHMVILCMYICRGWRFVLSTLPAFQNPSHRSLTSYQSRIIRSPSLSLSSFIYRIFLYKDGIIMMAQVLSPACIQQVGKTESHNDAVARSCGAVYRVLWSGSPRSSVSPPSPPHTPSPLPFSAHLRLVHL